MNSIYLDYRQYSFSERGLNETQSGDPSGYQIKLRFLQANDILKQLWFSPTVAVVTHPEESP